MNQTERLYDLLPAVHRARDAEDGLDGRLPLRSLLSVLAREVAVVEEDLAQLYDDLFVETCAEWVVPYIGDLVGVGGLHDLNGAASRRAQVANTVAYRRRKGTAAVLEGLARDVTGWPAHAVEFFRLLAATQHMNHVRLSNLASPDLRAWEPLEHAHTPFDTLSHTVDVRRIASGRGLHNIPNAGIFLWRLSSYPLTLSPAVRVDNKRYLFSPLGTDTQLYTKPEPEPDIGHISKPINVPAPISRRVLHERLDQYYGADDDFSDKSISLVGVYRKGTAQPTYEVVPFDADLVASCNLSDDGPRWAHAPAAGIFIDPVLGRIALSVAPPSSGSTLAALLVTYHHGFSADMGGGEYDRAAYIRTGAQRIERVMMPEIQEALEGGVANAPAAAQDELIKTSIRGALDELGAQGGVVEILDSGRYEETLAVNVGPGRNVEIRAADGHRPTVVLPGGDLRIDGGSGATDAESTVTLSGLLIVGGALKVSGNLGRLRLLDCTLVPGIKLDREGEPDRPTTPSLVVESQGTSVEIDRCIVGGVHVEAGSEARIANTILDATDAGNVAYAAKNGSGGRLRVETTTVVGGVNASVLELASNSIFLGEVTIQRRQQGCVRFSYLPFHSQTPRRHRCRPENETEAQRIEPQFVSLRYGDAAYCQLSRWCAQEIRHGADDESEMGAFHDLYAPQREANLRARLDEYLRFGLEAGVLYAT